ncbi:uncharacterized protein BKCO1_13000139 [Diplodia corticola]|uniref:Fungal calcium binding protein domain-containing protein n=1 Tax=Diplodia corticola TaxID=236234 RepID=A0A1J9S954_9PEZI|nr:uncharacterized protein BKCO1_13000139 [Diplodia corticola]OJD36109.1 hypothetical protein BKCO1_13000139 [Diplodia corticola]
MLFTSLIASALAVAATAAPNSGLTKRQANTSPNVTPEQIAFAVVQADCDILDCVGVVAAAGCIAAGIATADVPAVLACVVGGEGVLCDCAACIDALNDFLTDNGLCT